MTLHKILLLMLLIIVVIYANCMTSKNTFEPVYAAYEDSLSLYFYQGLYDQTLFPNDLLTNKCKTIFYPLNKKFLSFCIFYLLQIFFPFPYAMKFLSIVFCVFSTITIYKIGSYLRSQNYGLMLSGLFLTYFLSMDTFYGGQSRGSGALMVCLFLFYTIKKSFYFLPFFIILSIFFYPVVTPFVLMSCLLTFFFYKKDIDSPKKFFFLILVNLIVSINYNPFFESINYKKYYMLLGSYKFTLTVKEVINYRNWVDIFQYFILNLNEHSQLYSYYTLTFIALSLLFVISRRKNAFSLPKSIWMILMASFLSFLCIYPFYPAAASRQFVFTMPLFLILFVSENIYCITNKKMRSEIFIIPLIGLFMFLHPKFNDISTFKQYYPCYQYFEKLPKNILIAGHPKSDLIKSIPYFAKRTVYFHDKMYYAWLNVLTPNELDERHEALLKIYYSNSLKEISKFISETHIDYLIIETAFYNKLKLQNGNKEFILLELAKKYHDFTYTHDKGDISIYYPNDNDIYILNTKILKKLDPDGE